MLQTVLATIDEQGNVRLLEPIQLPEPRRALVTILPSESDISETALLSEAALSEDWYRPEEEEAWSHLQCVQPSLCPSHFLERRGEGVGIILDESTALSGKEPVYEHIDETLHLTIFAAKSLQEEQEL